MREQLAVDVGRALEHALAVVTALLVEHPEQEPDPLGRRSAALAQLGHGGLQRIAAQHSQVLGEKAPDCLHHEPLDLVGRRRCAVHERLVHRRDPLSGLFGQLTVMLDEDGLDVRAGQEAEGVVAVG